MARGLAAAALRARSTTRRGYTRSLYRVAVRTPVPTPGLVKLPAAWWSAAPRVRVRRLGLRLELDLRDNLSRTLYVTGTYEPGLLGLLRGALRRGDVLVDVGAHVGVHALTAAARLRRLGGGTVVAFEPARDSAATLRAAAARNRLDVTVVECALGRGPGTAELRADPAYGAADAGVRSLHGHGAAVQTVPVVAFDAWVRQAGLDRLDVVKLDVEGAELDALAGMRDSLARLRPRLLSVEVKDSVLRRAGTDGAAVRRLLRDCGYRPTGRVLDRNELFVPA